MDTKNTKRKGIRRFVALLATFVVAVTYIGANLMIVRADTTAAITVQNVESGATVKAYPIVTKESAGGWKAVSIEVGTPPSTTTYTIADVTKPTAEEIANLARNLSVLESTVTTANVLTLSETATGSNTYSYATADFGTYLVIVTPAAGNTKVYNPMIVSVNDNAGDATAGTVDANSNSTADLWGTAYAKSSDVSVSKIVTENSVTAAQGTRGAAGNGSTLGTLSRDVVSNKNATFEIRTTIPMYSEVYNNDNLKFEITDTLPAGLDAAKDIRVYNGTISTANELVRGSGTGTHYRLYEESTSGTEITADTTGNDVSTKKFVISFNKDYLLTSDTKDIIVVYNSVLNSSATSGFEANINTAKATYTNDPSSSSGKDTEEAKTYHYTFDINGSIYASTNGTEIRKVGVDDNGNDLLEERGTTSGVTAAQGAKFKLYRDAQQTSTVTADWNPTANGIEVGESETNANGFMSFTKLQTGRYYLVETQAPAGYAINNTPIKVEISAILDATTGKLTSYTIQIGDTYTNTYNATYVTAANPDTPTVTADSNNEPVDILNHKLGTLPSTGANGTATYTVIGVMVLAAAFGLKLVTVLIR